MLHLSVLELGAALLEGFGRSKLCFFLSVDFSVG